MAVKGPWSLTTLGLNTVLPVYSLEILGKLFKLLNLNYLS